MAGESFDYLETVKTLLRISGDEQDEVLNVYIQMVKESILNYCHIDELPAGLNFTLCQMAVEALRSVDIECSSSTSVSSVSEDGRTVQFDTSAVLNFLQDRVGNMAQLRRYRKIYHV